MRTWSFITILFSTSTVWSQTSHIEDFFKNYKKKPQTNSAFILDLRRHMAGLPPSEEIVKQTDDFNENKDDSIDEKSKEKLKKILISSVEFPVSRSLQKQKTSSKFPRQVTGISKFTTDFNGEIFLGYAPEAMSMEVISWDPEKKKYEFFEIENYGPGLSPKLKKSDDRTCVKCHQAGGPIFSHEPWFESNSATDARVRKFHERNIAEARKNLNPEESALLKFADSLSEDNNILQLDDSIRASNRRLQTEKLCRSIKSSKAPELLFQLISAIHTEPSPEQHAIIRAKLDELIGTTSYPSSVILDHDPSTALGPRGPVGIITDKTLEEINIQSTSRAIHDKSSFVKDQPLHFVESLASASPKGIQIPAAKVVLQSKEAENSWLNPLTPRPIVSSLYDNKDRALKAFGTCYYNDEDALVGLTEVPLKDLKKILAAINLSKLPAEKKLLVKAINDYFVAQECEIETDPKLEELNRSRQKIVMEFVKKGYNVNEAINEDRAFQNFQKNCLDCHSGPDAMRNLRVPENKGGMQKFAEHMLDRPERNPIMKLHDESMPMSHSVSPSDRREMIIYLIKFLNKNGPK